MKSHKFIFWIATIIIFLFQGVMPAFTSQTEMAKEGIRHLGYPDYFGVALAVFKVIGAFILIVPQIPSRLKEWAYAGFNFDFLFAFISIWAVEGISGMAFFPLIMLAILMLSYFYHHKLQAHQLKVD